MTPAERFLPPRAESAGSSTPSQKFVCPITNDPDLPHDGTIKHGGCWCAPCRSAYNREYQRWADPDYDKRQESRLRATRGRLLYAKRPWSCEEDALLGTDTDRAVGLLIDRNEQAVNKRRNKLRIQPHRKGRRHLSGKGGYIQVALAPDDPFVEMSRGRDRTVLEHRLVMAEHLGRPLATDEIVHHRNGIKTDNRIENLELWTRAHSDGQRVEDVFAWCVEFIERYAKEIDEI